MNINKVAGSGDIKVINIRTAKGNGMTVRDLMNKLSYFNPDHRVVYYDANGETYNIVQAVQDNKNTIALF